MSLSTIIRNRRKMKSLSQRDVANAIGMKLSTYSLREREGGFTESELALISKKLKINFEELQEAAQEPVVVIDDAIEWLTKSSLKLEATQRVMLMAMSEILAQLKKESVSKVMTEFSELLRVELQQTLQDKQA